MGDTNEKAKPFNWAKFQQNMGYSDQEMAHLPHAAYLHGLLFSVSDVV